MLKKPANQIKAVLGFVVLSMALTTQSVYAQKTGTVTRSKVDSIDQVQAPLREQTFVRHGLFIQFRYVGDHLDSLLLENKSTTVLSVEMFNESYILAPKDYVTINPPNVKYALLSLSTYVPYRTSVDNVLSERFKHLYIYRMPITKVSKSVT